MTQTRYIVEIRSAENGTYYLGDEGMKGYGNIAYADKWTSRREAEYIANAYLKDCIRAEDELGMMRDDRTAVLLTV